MDEVKELEDAIVKAWSGKGRSMFTFQKDGEIQIKHDDFDMSVYSPRLDSTFQRRLQQLKFKVEQERKRERMKNRFKGI